MREEELIKKLKSVELPQIQLQSHRCRLRTALLDAGCQKERPKVIIWGLAKSKLEGGIDTMRQGLVSWQPVRKIAIAGVLALVLIAGSVVALPLLTGQSPEVLAADIAKNSPQVQAFIAEGATLKEVVAEDNLYRVTFELFSEDLGEVRMAALVDIDELRTVRIIAPFPMRTPYCPDIYLCEEALQKIVAEMVPHSPRLVPPAEPPITGESLDRLLEIAREVAYDDWCDINITNVIIVAALWRWDGVRWVQVAQDYDIESNPCWRGRITAYARPICANPATGWHVVTIVRRIYTDGWRGACGWQESFPPVWLIVPE